jgi:hypothetical protein
MKKYHLATLHEKCQKMKINSLTEEEESTFLKKYEGDFVQTSPQLFGWSTYRDRYYKIYKTFNLKLCNQFPPQKQLILLYLHICVLWLKILGCYDISRPFKVIITSFNLTKFWYCRKFMPKLMPKRFHKIGSRKTLSKLSAHSFVKAKNGA